MADPFVAEIRIFPFNFDPLGWAHCNGALLPVTQNQALFVLLGTTYGGDGRTTFALPDMIRRAPLHRNPPPPNQAPGLSERSLGEMGGAETVTLLQSEMPIHTHSLQATTALANTNQPAGALLARAQFSFQGRSGSVPIYSNEAPDTQMGFQALTPTGGDQPHNNMQPYLKMNFCIALQGVFPPPKT